MNNQGAISACTQTKTRQDVFNTTDDDKHSAEANLDPNRCSIAKLGGSYSI